MKRLGIIVPYRDRKEHLAQLVPHLAAYFTRDKVDSAVPVKLVIVEQAPGLPFNRGLINNIGYALLRGEVDYVCFHDVDFLPIWADYSYPELPTMIIWFGMESRPFDPARPDKRIWYRLERCLAAVVQQAPRSWPHFRNPITPKANIIVLRINFVRPDAPIGFPHQRLSL